MNREKLPRYLGGVHAIRGSMREMSEEQRQMLLHLMANPKMLNDEMSRTIYKESETNEQRRNVV